MTAIRAMSVHDFLEAGAPEDLTPREQDEWLEARDAVEAWAERCALTGPQLEYITLGDVLAAMDDERASP